MPNPKTHAVPYKVKSNITPLRCQSLLSCFGLCRCDTHVMGSGLFWYGSHKSRFALLSSHLVLSRFIVIMLNLDRTLAYSRGDHFFLPLLLDPVVLVILEVDIRSPMYFCKNLLLLSSLSCSSLTASMRAKISSSDDWSDLACLVWVISLRP
jgi:hypothetical protein